MAKPPVMKTTTAPSFRRLSSTFLALAFLSGWLPLYHVKIESPRRPYFRSCGLCLARLAHRDTSDSPGKTQTIWVTPSFSMISSFMTWSLVDVQNDWAFFFPVFSFSFFDPSPAEFFPPSFVFCAQLLLMSTIVAGRNPPNHKQQFCPLFSSAVPHFLFYVSVTSSSPFSVAVFSDLLRFDQSVKTAKNLSHRFKHQLRPG